MDFCEAILHAVEILKNDEGIEIMKVEEIGPQSVKVMQNALCGLPPKLVGHFAAVHKMEMTAETCMSSVQCVVNLSCNRDESGDFAEKVGVIEAIKWPSNDCIGVNDGCLIQQILGCRFLLKRDLSVTDFIIVFVFVFVIPISIFNFRWRSWRWSEIAQQCGDSLFAEWTEGLVFHPLFDATIAESVQATFDQSAIGMVQ